MVQFFFLRLKERKFGIHGIIIIIILFFWNRHCYLFELLLLLIGLVCCKNMN